MVALFYIVNCLLFLFVEMCLHILHMTHDSLPKSLLAMVILLILLVAFPCFCSSSTSSKGTFLFEILFVYLVFYIHP